MNSFKLLLAGVVLCASQAAFAADSRDSGDSSSKASNSQSEMSQEDVNKAVNEAAKNGVSASDIAVQLQAAGVSTEMISKAISANISVGGGYTSANLVSAQTSMTLAKNAAPTASGGGEGRGGDSGGRGGLASLGGGFSSGGLSGGPSGAVSPN